MDRWQVRTPAYKVKDDQFRPRKVRKTVALRSIRSLSSERRILSLKLLTARVFKRRRAMNSQKVLPSVTKRRALYESGPRVYVLTQVTGYVPARVFAFDARVFTAIAFRASLYDAPLINAGSVTCFVY